MHIRNRFSLMFAFALLPALASAVSCRTALLDGSRSLQYYNATSAAEYDNNPGIDLGFGDSHPDDVGFFFYDFHNQLSSEVGSFDLASGGNDNLQTCLQCILVREDLGNGQNKMLFQTGGTLTVDPSTPPGSDPILLTWQNVTLAEVTVSNTGVSTFVPNGECYAIVIDKIFVGGFEASE